MTKAPRLEDPEEDLHLLDRLEVTKLARLSHPG